MHTNRSLQTTLRRILFLAWPVLLEQVLHTIVQYTDSAMVGRVGAQATAAVGLTTTVNWLVMGPGGAVSVGVVACVARALGANNHEEARSFAAQAMRLVWIIGLSLAVITLAVSPFLPRWMGAEREIWRNASWYFAIISAPMLFRMQSTILGSALRAAGDTKTPMLISLGINALNIVLNFLLIYPTRTLTLGALRWQMLGMGWGVVGAATATAISYTLGGLLIRRAFVRNAQLYRGRMPYNRDTMGEILRISIPAALERIASSSGQVVFATLVTGLGTTALAAHSLAITAEQAVYLPGFALETAAATLCGNAVGERDPGKVRYVALLSMGCAVLLMTCTGAVAFLWPTQILRIFTADAAVLALGSRVLRLVAASEPIYAVSIVLAGVYNGIGQSRLPFVCSLFCMWGVRICFTLLCVRVFHMGLFAVWVCMIADNIARALWLAVCFGRGKWKLRIATRAQSADNPL